MTVVTTPNSRGCFGIWGNITVNLLIHRGRFPGNDEIFNLINLSTFTV